VKVVPFKGQRWGYLYTKLVVPVKVVPFEGQRRGYHWMWPVKVVPFEWQRLVIGVGCASEDCSFYH